MFALVDCNNFYASCERVFNPALRNRPVVVLSNNDGCIIARSEEAKALGIKMGTPMFKCRDVLLQQKVAVFSSNYSLYGDMSSRVMTTLAGLAPDIELYSIDEAFLDMSGFGRYDLTEYGRLIRRTVHQHTGIPVCVGIAPTKTLAKIANRLAKKSPDYQGVCLLNSDEEVRRALSMTKVEDVWGIGRQLSKLLYARNINTAADLAAAPATWVRKHLHITGARVQAELTGHSCLPIELVRPAKQGICTSRSFGQSVKTWDDLHRAVATFAGKCAVKLRKEQAVALMLTLFIGTSPFDDQQARYWGTKTIALPYPTQDSMTLIRAAQSLLDLLFRRGCAYRKAGVIVSELSPVELAGRTLSLFADDEPADSEQSKKLMKVMDGINELYGRGAVRLASENSVGWKPNQERLSPCCTTRWSDIMEVKG
ncbi:MAG: Y-family DNA polymerase [Chlorobium sp.]|nr:MAG: Y-family DNA polymerase [Chlorobium sp.]